MIGLEPFRPDLKDHDAIVNTIENAVQRFTVEELEHMNLENRQAGVPVLKHDEFLKTDHVGYLDGSKYSLLIIWDREK